MGNYLSEKLKKRFSFTVKDTNSQEDKPFKMWCDQTACHGVFDVYYSKHVWSFIFWTLLVIGCFFMTIYQINALLMESDAPPHYDTTIDVNLSAIDWPNVTVCNLNRINSESAMFEVKMSSKAITWLLGSPMLPYDFPLWKLEIAEYQKKWEQFLNNSEPYDKSVDGLFRYLGTNCWIFFFRVGCSFGTEIFECCNYATAIMNREFGLCWSITPPPKPGQNKPLHDVPGPSYGMRLTVTPKLHYYLSKEHILNNYLSEGIVVSVDYNPYRFAFANPIFVTPGKQAKITLKATINQYNLPSIRMYEPECVEKRNTDMKILRGDYDKENCYFDCVQQESLHQCGCILLSEHKTNYSICNTTDLYRCYNTTDFAALNLRSQRFQHCTSLCLQTCEASTEIQAESSLSDYATPKYLEAIHARYAEILYAGRDLDELPDRQRTFLESLAGAVARERDEHIYLNIYFPERGHTVINRKEKVSVFQLLANIGGEMGLWLGASLITIVQAIYYCAYGIFRSIYNNGIKSSNSFDMCNGQNNFRETKENCCSSLVYLMACMQNCYVQFNRNCAVSISDKF